MSQDILGYNVESNMRHVASADLAVLDSGEGKVNLVQNTQIQYGHRVEPKYETGSSTVYFVNGQPSGQMSIGRLVGKSGLMDGHVINRADPVNHFEMKQFHLNIRDEYLNIQGTAGYRIETPVLANFSLQYGAGQLEIAEMVNYIFASLHRADGSGGGLNINIAPGGAIGVNVGGVSLG